MLVGHEAFALLRAEGAEISGLRQPVPEPHTGFDHPLLSVFHEANGKPHCELVGHILFTSRHGHLVDRNDGVAQLVEKDAPHGTIDVARKLLAWQLHEVVVVLGCSLGHQLDELQADRDLARLRIEESICHLAGPKADVQVRSQGERGVDHRSHSLSQLRALDDLQKGLLRRLSGIPIERCCTGLRHGLARQRAKHQDARDDRLPVSHPPSPLIWGKSKRSGLGRVRGTTGTRARSKGTTFGKPVPRWFSAPAA